MNLPPVTMPKGLPAPDQLAMEHSNQLMQILRNHIKQAGGKISFEQWMQIALYEPGYGYYSAGNTKFNRAGDFITAPETSYLFGATLANQIIQILDLSNSNTILEFGAGTGALAKSIIQRLNSLGKTVNYQILELSADLRTRQAQTLAGFGSQVRWLDQLPDAFTGCVIANEVLDAMPVNLFQIAANGDINILGVCLSPQDHSPGFAWTYMDHQEHLVETIKSRIADLNNYQSEINLQAEAWINQMGKWLKRGAAILIDYGFPQHEYYHPQRSQGSLMCHFRHHAHDQPLVLAGIQDITAHIDFTAMADAALEANLEVMGYTSQARFLLNCGLTDLLAVDFDNAAERARQLTNINTLISEAEMGELFKVMVLGKNIDPPLTGFIRSDRRDYL